MGPLTLIGMAVTTIAFLMWEHRRSTAAQPEADKAGTGAQSWTDFYTEDRQEAHALRHNPEWLAELRRRRAAVSGQSEVVQDEAAAAEAPANDQAGRDAA